MNAANNSCSPTIIEYTEFYNIALDHMDLMKVVLVLAGQMFSKISICFQYLNLTLDFIQ